LFSLICFFFLILRKKLVWRGILIIVSGIIISVVSFIFFEATGIIDLVYFFIIAVACATVIAIYKGEYLNEQLKKITSFNIITEKSLDYTRDGYKYLLGRVFQVWLALGASLGVSMSILFRHGFDDPALKFMAAKMLFGFIGISLALGYWVAIPLLNGIVDVQETLNSLKISGSKAATIKSARKNRMI